MNTRGLGRLLARSPALAAAGLVRLYQLFVSPLLHLIGGPGSGCRFSPSCSEYARGALHAHGLWRGLWLSLRRISRCHRWNPGGYDPVPPRRSR